MESLLKSLVSYAQTRIADGRDYILVQAAGFVKSFSIPSFSTSVCNNSSMCCCCMCCC